MKPIYLDNNATTMVAPEVVEVMLPLFSDLYGNASSMHTFGGQMKKYMDIAREQVANILHAYPDEIIFTSCGTESDNTAISSAFETQPAKNTLVTTRVEHSAVINTAQHIESVGKNVIWLNVDEKGQLDLNELKDTLNQFSNDIAMVSIMYANNETGTIFPIDEIAQAVKAHGIQLHVDAVQIVGKQELNLSKTPIDFLALSGHKLHAPKGVGVLYVRRGTRFRPFMIGGHQEDSRRAGTENVPYIVGLGKACDIAQTFIHEENTKVARLRDKLESSILKLIPDAQVNGDTAHRLPNTSNISFKYIEGEALLLLLNEYGICASSGSACTSGSLEPSHVLRAMGVPFTFAHGSLRFSLSRYTTEADIDKVIEVLPGIVKKLREFSPFIPRG